MPDRRTHRGRHPEDDRLFAPTAWPMLCRAVEDLSWLLTGGYAEKSALKLVGDHFQLNERQRMAVMRCACSDASLAHRRRTEAAEVEVRDQPLLIDGYNVLTSIEAALAGGVVLEGRDGCYRDMASMHGTFRQVKETMPASELIGRVLADLGVAGAVWYLDRPVSNSGRLRTTLLAAAGGHGWSWQVELVADPDAVLAASEALIATADSVVLDRCTRWFNLVRQAIAMGLPSCPIVRLHA
ncbi:MAG TPA: DUF434 domain-containing protein [Phycisphaerae bacterium]|nr:DUF434 domain-containing protein [Phycisphaerae bacterium]HRY69848.1 DUF434 domain-containing protein [Phycisphaerae bacterium]